MRRRLSGARRVHGPVRGASPAGNDLVKRTSPMIACVALLACGFGAAALAQQSASARKSAAATHPAPLEGDWSGVLQVGETQLHLVLHLSKDTHGQWHAAVDSLDQAVYGMEASKVRSEEHTSELQSLTNLVCRLLLEKKKKKK